MPKTIAVALGLMLAIAAAVPQAAEPRSDSMFGRGRFKPADPITLEQRQLLAAKLSIVQQLVQSALQGRETSADHRMWLLESLYRMPISELAAIAPDVSHDGLVKTIATKASRAAPKLGGASSELVYYPITPCRYLDSRNVGGVLVAGSPRAIDLANTGTTYGGAGSCDPRTAVGGNEDTIGAIAINVTIVAQSSAPGYIGARPAGSTGTTSLVNWYEPNAQAANAGVIPTSQTPGVNAELEFFGSPAPAHFIVDVFGVFAAPNATPLDCVTGTVATQTATTASRNFNVAADACPTNYSMVSNSCQATFGDFTNGAVALAAQGSGFGISTPFMSNCVGYYSGSSSVTIENTPWCCRIPGR